MAGLAFSPPNTTFSQNNGVIALTKVASRYVGLAAATWMFLLGRLGGLLPKVGWAAGSYAKARLT